MIPVCEPLLGEREAEYALECLRTNWISSKGRYVTELEQGFAEYCGCRHGIATTSGTTALHLALAALGAGPGDEVVVPALTMVASVFAVLYTGARPVLVDSERETGNIDVGQLESRLTPSSRAIMPVHVYGHPCDMDELLAVAQAHGVLVVEDAAEAHGAEYRGRKTGGLGTVGCFSFYANKIITTGEGGMVVTDDDEIADRCRLLKNQAYAPNAQFVHSELGFNYRMTNVQAAIGLAQFERIDELVERRRRNAALYSARLKEIPGLTLPGEKHGVKNVHWMYAIVVEDGFGIGRDELIQQLAEAGIEAKPFFVPMHRQPAFTALGLFASESYPVAEELSRRGLYLPSGSGLSADELEQVCEAIAAIRRRSAARMRTRAVAG